MAARVADPGLRAAMQARLGHCEYAVGEYDRAIARLKPAAAACEAHGRLEDAAFAYMAWAWVAMYRGDHDEAIAVGGEALRILREQFHLQYSVWVRMARSVSLSHMARWDEAIAESERALADADRYDDDGCRVMAWTPLALAHTLRGDPARGAEYGRKALQTAPTPVERSVAIMGLGLALCHGPGPEEGIELAAPLVAMARIAKHRSVEALAVVLGGAYVRVGDLDAARTTLEEALRLCEEHGMKYAGGLALRALGELAIAENPAQVEEPLAAPVFERALAVFRATGAPNDAALTDAAYAQLLAQQGRAGEARRRLAAALETFERLGTRGAPDRVRAQLAALPRTP
jgi:tetratricopeptide (TPR) repeat protein